MTDVVKVEMYPIYRARCSGAACCYSLSLSLFLFLMYVYFSSILLAINLFYTCLLVRLLHVPRERAVV